MAQTQIAFRVSEDVAAELERGRVEQHYTSQVEYISALILAGGGRLSGLSAQGLWDATATDSRVGGAITNAISFIEHGDSDKAIDELRFAQDVILEAMMKKKPAIDQAVTERLRIRGGGDDWSQAEREG